MAINLLPWREILMTRKKRYYWLAILLTIILVCIIACAGRYYLIYLNRNYQFRNIQLTKLIQTNQLPDDEKSLTADFENNEQRIKLIQMMDQTQKRFWQELDFLQKAPKAIQFSHLTWVQGELKIQGYSAEADIVGSFIKNLENSQLFSQVSLSNLNQDNKTGALNFILNLTQPQENTP